MSRLIVFFLLLVLSACSSNKSANISPARQKAILDSLIRVEQKEIEAFEKERLRDRMSIEVKVKADSILAEHEQQRAQLSPKTDTTTAEPKLSDTTQNTQ